MTSWPVNDGHYSLPAGYRGIMRTGTVFTPHEKVDAEIEIGNTATVCFRQIQGWKNRYFIHTITTESEVCGNNYFWLVRTTDMLK